MPLKRAGMRILPPRSVPIPITEAAAVIREDSPPIEEKKNEISLRSV